MGGTAVAALLIAGPARGPAYAVELGAAGAASSATRTRPQLQADIAEPQHEVTVPPAGEGDGTLDLSGILTRDKLRPFTGSSAVFDPSFGPINELEEELEDIEHLEQMEVKRREAKGLITLGATGVGLFYIAKAGLSLDEWMKDQERKSIQREIELTGQYIAVDAGDIETAIDPKTGKNITLRSARKKPAGFNASEDTVQDPAAEETEPSAKGPSWMPRWFPDFSKWSSADGDDFLDDMGMMDSVAEAAKLYDTEEMDDDDTGDMDVLSDLKL